MKTKTKKVSISFSVPDDKIAEVKRAVAKVTAVPKPIKRQSLPYYSPGYQSALIKRALKVRAELMKIEKALSKYENVFDDDLTPTDEKWVNENYDRLERTLDRCKLTVEDF